MSGMLRSLAVRQRPCIVHMSGMLRSMAVRQRPCIVHMSGMLRSMGVEFEEEKIVISWSADLILYSGTKTRVIKNSEMGPDELGLTSLSDQ
jgi:hypothetical protein